MNNSKSQINSSTAMQQNLSSCHDCGKLFACDGREGGVCPRCHAPAHFRKKSSISRTWALLLAAMVMLVPANFLPIMEVAYLGGIERSTIMDGIIYFLHDGEYGIAMVIFTASVLVPLFKVIGLFLILLSVHFRWPGWLKHRTKMYRFISFIGRWSMLDIFVIALLCTLVQFSSLSSINPAPAATYFSIVVLLTMLAAGAFDTRILWDVSAES